MLNQLTRSMAKPLQFAFLISVFSLIFISSASFPSRDSLGIAPQDESYYKASVIKCKDGSKKFTKNQLNDEFCDCPDGTDEPGTSACPEGKFYCRNSGHSPLKIYSSRVNDGICDCCDGSDEYDGKVNCSNTCWEAGKAAREKLRKKITTFKEGAIIRNKEVENAKVAFAKDEAELAKLKSEEKMLKNLVDQLKEQKERIEKAEAEEKAKKEAEEKRLKEEAEKLAAKETESVEKKEEVLEPLTEEKENEDKSEEQDKSNELSNRMPPSEKYAKYVQEMDENQNKPIKAEHEKEEVITEQHSSDDSSTKEPNAAPSEQPEGLSKEELGRLVASRWTGEKSNDENTPPAPNDENTPENEDNFFKDHEPSEEDEKYEEGYHSEMEDDRHKYKYEDSDENKYEDESDEEYENDDSNHDKIDDDDDSDKNDNSGSWTWLDKIQQTVQSVFQSFNFFKTPVDLSEASRVRKEYDDLSSKLSKIQSRISNLNDKFKHDFGKDKEFYSFYDQCFENKQNKYVYKVCPYKRATQNEGHSSTELGRWEKFEDSYRVMVFSNGDHCWNGPNRSLKVRLRCGLKNEVADVDEPSRCEYVAILSTPAMCVEEKLKELEQKLVDLKTSQPSVHDEL
ncbi:hypothetical protein LUZ60_004019 [Juncus effusus]|nr:hypothetical protein LUZ60_004019 [Juncus effusus]